MISVCYSILYIMHIVNSGVTSPEFEHRKDEIKYTLQGEL